MRTSERLTDDEASGAVGTMVRPATRRGARPRPPAAVAEPGAVAAPAERRGRPARPEIPPQRQAPRRGTAAPKAAPKAEPARVPQAGPREADAPAGAHRGPFVVLLCGLLGGALVSALVITTTLAQGAFEISKLQDSIGVLARQKQALADQVAQAQSAQAIQQRALELGMRPVGVVRFLDPRTGKVRTDAATGFVNSIHVPGYTP